MPTPPIQDYILDSSAVAVVDNVLLLARLKLNNQRAQNRMKQSAGIHRVDRQFDVDCWVFLKLKPYRQVSVHRRAGYKLAKHLFGSFQIAGHIGPVAYHLKLPAECKIHNVFHISLLKPCRGGPTPPQASLPSSFYTGHPLLPEQILGFRNVMTRDKQTPQLLIRWQSQSAADVTWEFADPLSRLIPPSTLRTR